jgi:glycosyltransferase involved in cell wall biosynthesis
MGMGDKGSRMAAPVWNEERTLPLSAFIICVDEERYVGNCIESLDLCREIVIVDSGSTDGTLALIQSYIDKGWPIRLYSEPWRGYAGQKQFALELCREEWCFNIDADERMDRALKEALPELLKNESVVGWRIARRPYLIGYGYSPASAYERRNLRLIRRGRGGYDLAQQVHEGIRPDGPVEPALKGSLLHYRLLQMDKQILKENKYSTLKADQLVESGQKPRKIRMVFNPPLYFFRLYFRNGLWRCGFPGFIEAMTGVVYSFMTEAKIFQRNAMREGPPFDNFENE